MGGVHAEAPPRPEPTRAGTPRPEKGLLEQTWDFFASVPVATVLIFLIALASVAGSLIEQEGQYSDWRPPAEYYPARYGPVVGLFLYRTGLTRMYTSWWYLTLLFLLGASLVICSLERFIPLWRSVQRPNPAPDPAFVKGLKRGFTYSAPATGDPLAPLEALLRRRGYGVVRSGDRLYADRGRWGRWGPYITHIGLLVVLAGGMLRAVPGMYMDEFIWVRDGQTVRVPGADWYLRSEKFTVELHPNGMPKAYETDAVVVEGGADVHRQVIRLNQPLAYRGIELYQTSYKQELGVAQVALQERASGQEIGRLAVDLRSPAESYLVAGYAVRVKEYYPDFTLDDKGKPVTRSGEAQNPGLILEVITPEGKRYVTWYFPLYPEMDFDPSVPVRFQTVDIGVAGVSGLKVKKDAGVPVIYFGLAIVSLGVCLTFYIAHRRMWALVEGERVVVGGWTNRNTWAFEREIEAMARHLDSKRAPDLEEDGR